MCYTSKPSTYEIKQTLTERKPGWDQKGHCSHRVSGSWTNWGLIWLMFSNSLAPFSATCSEHCSVLLHCLCVDFSRSTVPAVEYCLFGFRRWFRFACQHTSHRLEGSTYRAWNLWIYSFEVLRLVPMGFQGQHPWILQILHETQRSVSLYYEISLETNDRGRMLVPTGALVLSVPKHQNPKGLMSHPYIYIWGFPYMGVPLNPFIDGFSLINHPAFGVTPHDYENPHIDRTVPYTSCTGASWPSLIAKFSAGRVAAKAPQHFSYPMVCSDRTCREKTIWKDRGVPKFYAITLFPRMLNRTNQKRGLLMFIVEYVCIYIS